jgi:hypothetical protein
LDAIVVSVTERDFLFADRRQRPTQEQEKVLRELLQIRRNDIEHLMKAKLESSVKAVLRAKREEHHYDKRK